jgi:hypothetical protein
MALPNGAGGYQVGDGNLTEAVLGVQTIPASLTGDTTLLLLKLQLVWLFVQKHRMLH